MKKHILKKHMLLSIILGSLAIVAIVVLSIYFFSGGSSESTSAGSHCNAFSMEVDKEDAERIQTIVTTIANTSPMRLLFKKGELEKMGDILDAHVPPFTFLWYIFSDQNLANEMKKMQKSSMKYSRFVEGLQKNLIKEYEAGCFFAHAKSFCKAMGLNEDEVMAILKEGIEKAHVKKDKQAFTPFVDYLIAKKATAS